MHVEDPMCPLCGEEYHASLHLLGSCSALVEKGEKQFGKHFLVPSELKTGALEYVRS